jgi:hypothetical protein
MKEIIIKYQTAAIVPAPYAYYYTLKSIGSETGGLIVDFVLNYLDRDSITEEEILDEGFSMEDDLTWKGELPMVWARELKSLLKNSQLVEDGEESELEEYIGIERTFEGKSESLFPAKKKAWSYFLQELMQAIFEAAGRENAFELDYLQIKEGKETALKLKASFISKLFSVHAGKEMKMLEWGFLEDCMKTIFQADFVTELALESRPKLDGLYLSPGDGFWYKSGESLQNPSPRSKVLNEIESFFSNLKRTVAL